MVLPDGTSLASVSRVKEPPGPISLDDVQAETVDFLWHPYIPLRKLTLCEGDPGLGKSWLTLAIATALSQGRGLPGKGEFDRQVTLVMSAEDGLEDTIKPRLEKLGAACEYIFALKELFVLNDSGLSYLDRAVKRISPSLVVIDPLFAYFDRKSDINQANQTRAIMARLARLAESNNCAILAIRHLTKGNRSKSIHRGIGSIDLTAAARSVLLVGSDPDESFHRALVHIKSNLAPIGDSLGFEIKEGAFYWKGRSDLTADQILAPEPTSEERSALNEAVDFLEELLSNGPVESREAKRQARAAGIVVRTIWRTKRILSKKEGTQWYWHITPHARA